MTSNHQEIMEQAYSRWANGWSKEQFWAQLSEREKVAVFVGNLNYQVENGGWGQWCCNRYVECATELESILRDTIGTKTAVEVADMVSKVSSAWERFESDSNATPDYYSCSCDDECSCETEEDVWASANASFEIITDPLNGAFYAINAQLLKDTEDYLAGHELEKHVPVANTNEPSKSKGPSTNIRCQLIGRDGNALHSE